MFRHDRMAFFYCAWSCIAVNVARSTAGRTRAEGRLTRHLVTSYGFPTASGAEPTTARSLLGVAILLAGNWGINMGLPVQHTVEVLEVGLLNGSPGEHPTCWEDCRYPQHRPGIHISGTGAQDAAIPARIGTGRNRLYWPFTNSRRAPTATYSRQQKAGVLDTPNYRLLGSGGKPKIETCLDLPRKSFVNFVPSPEMGSILSNRPTSGRVRLLPPPILLGSASWRQMTPEQAVT
jgi:hypothetical protein